MSIFNCLYFLALSYLIIAAVIYVITVLIIFLDKKKRYFNSISEMSSSRPVQIITAMITPLIMALGWVFLFPFRSEKK